ncbi:hypothetical protein [Acidiferrobacter sp. SPIII_3]|uniref:hypothetical protein n=1 Tax=Acidiferrobacter sp. SPIII_3 TaxID=1281578 RepID=UPI0011AB5670|nr:hypothetical protein [Acidiferrobacter sp. SPIII_3]
MKAGTLENTRVGLSNIALMDGNGKSPKLRNFYTGWLVQHRLDGWQRQVAEAAQLRNALAHGNEELLSAATFDEAGSRLQFIGEMINRVCGGDFLKLKSRATKVAFRRPSPP